MKLIPLILIMLVLTGCAGSFVGHICTMRGDIYVGMSADKIAETLGPPNSVGQYPYYNYQGSFFGYTPGTQTIEWAWLGAVQNKTVVAYIEYGNVARIGVVE